MVCQTRKNVSLFPVAQTLALQFVDRLYAIGSVRRFLWRQWYGLLTRRLRDEDVLFLNYAYEEQPPLAIPLAPSESANRGCIQLYHHVAAQAALARKDVLEISCGHGGGASYISRTFTPRRYVGLDLNGPGILFCRKKHALAGLEFVQGDAENLPFPAATFDSVVNVEASHCYASMSRFFEEVARVLRPGGLFHYADFRFHTDVLTWENQIASSPLQVVKMNDISDCVLRGMEMNSARSTSLVKRHLPKFLHRAGEGFAGVKGSGIYNALQKGELSYRSYLLQRPS
jgi:ubiquinone/menaquinone biosynthesis C-methylase UbiE